MTHYEQLLLDIMMTMAVCGLGAIMLLVAICVVHDMWIDLRKELREGQR